MAVLILVYLNQIWYSQVSTNSTFSIILTKVHEWRVCDLYGIACNTVN